MEKKFSTRLVAEIEQKANDRPFEISFGLYKESKFTSRFVRTALVEIWYLSTRWWFKHYGIESERKSMQTFMRNQAMMAMIRDKVWSAELAEFHEITEADVVFHYSFLKHIEVTVNCEYGTEFREYIIAEATERYELERERAETYKEGIAGKFATGGFLRQLLAAGKYKREHKQPRILIEDELYDRVLNRNTVTMERLQEEMVRLKNSSDQKRITSYRYKKDKDILEKKMSDLRQRRRKLFEWMLLDRESSNNMTFIKAVGIYELEILRSDRLGIYRGERSYLDHFIEPDKPLKITRLKVTSISQGKKLIDLYRAWYNEKHKVEIEANKPNKKKESSKKYKDKLLASSRQERSDRDEAIIALWEKGIRNKALIGRETNVATSTVKDVITKYEQNKINAPVEVETHPQEGEEELALRETLYERECLSIEKHERTYEQRRFNKNLEGWHKLGKNPTQISKFIDLPATEIADKLRGLNIVPHYDVHTSTEAEIAEYVRLQEQEERDREERQLNGKKLPKGL